MNVNPVYPALETLTSDLKRESALIPKNRLSILDQITYYIKESIAQHGIANLTFICTHNSRRSHIAQIWAQAAAYLVGLKNVFCFSGGTEATAFNPRAVTAMRDAGFHILIEKEGDNPGYAVAFSDHASAIKVFSKTYDDPVNPKKMFAAVMTCSHADENCPFIPGADLRIALTYDDPKDFDGTALEGERYATRVREIGREILYAMSKVKT